MVENGHFIEPPSVMSMHDTHPPKLKHTHGLSVAALKVQQQLTIVNYQQRYTAV